MPQAALAVTEPTPVVAEPASVVETPAAAAPAAEPAKVEATPAATPTPTVAEQLTAAMKEGIAKATPGAEPAKPAEVAPVPGSPEALAAAEVAKAAGNKLPAAEPAKDELLPADAAFLEVLKSGGATKTTTDRFKELAAFKRDFAPVQEMLEKAGIKDVAEIPKLVDRAKQADGLIEMVMDTGATAEQYATMLDYQKIAVMGMKGDRKAAEKALELATAEMQVWAKALGKEIPGINDPLEGHTDLEDAVESGAITREYALELAKQRDSAKTQADLHAQTQQQTAQTQATAAAIGEIAQFDQAMLASDPTYAGKRNILSALVKTIKETSPPSKWLEATKLAYSQIPAMPAAVTPAPLPAKPLPGAVRPGGPTPILAPTFASPEEAMRAGIANAG